MTPSIGRVVWYYPAGGSEQPWPALISKVHAGNTINVGGFRPDGTPFDAQEIPLCLPAENPYAGVSHCTWMPYQVGAAAEQAGKVSPKLTPLNQQGQSK